MTRIGCIPVRWLTCILSLACQSTVMSLISVKSSSSGIMSAYQKLSLDRSMETLGRGGLDTRQRTRTKYARISHSLFRGPTIVTGAALVQYHHRGAQLVKALHPQCCHRSHRILVGQSACCDNDEAYTRMNLTEFQ
jgi:hypothetical protein